MEKAELKEPVVVSKALVLSSCSSSGLGGKRTKQDYKYLFYFLTPGSRGKDAFKHCNWKR